MYNNVHQRLRRFISLSLVLAMLVNTVLPSVWAKDTLFSLVDFQGDTITEDASWEEMYPHGTFAFAQSQVALTEGGEAQSLTIYRLGGGIGESTAHVLFTPPADENNRYYAASSNDYTILDPTEGISYDSDIYGNVQIDVVFGEFEYEKTIIVEPVDDDEHESLEFILATIIGVTGDAIFTESANRATLMFNDNEEVIPSIAAFADTIILADRNAQNAYVTITRSEGIQYAFSVDYQTGENTALAGVDYAERTETVFFEPGETEKTVLIPLVQDYIHNPDYDINFFIALSNPRTGSLDEGARYAAVHISNSYQSDVTPAGELDDVEDPGEEPLGIMGALFGSEFELTPDAPNLITLIAQDNDQRVDVNTDNPALIANTNQELGIMDATAIAEAEAIAKANMPMAMNYIPPSDAITFGVSATVPWKKYAVLADYDNIYSDDDSQIIYPTLFKFNDIWNERNKAGSTGTYVRKFDNVDLTAPSLNAKHGGNSDAFTDPNSTFWAKNPISNMYEYYAGLSYRMWTNFSDDYSFGAFGFTSDPSITHQKDSYFMMDKEGGQKNNWGDDMYLKDLLDSNKHPSLTNVANSSASVYPVFGIHDMGGGNNSTFRVEILRFVLTRAAPINLAVEYYSADAFVDTDEERANPLFVPVLSVTDGGLDATTGHPYIGSTISISPNSNSGSYRIRSVTLQMSTTEKGSYTTINTGAVNGSHIGTLKIASDSVNEATRMDQLSCMNYDTNFYKIVIEYETVKDVSLTINDAIMAADTASGYIQTVDGLRNSTSSLNATLYPSAHIAITDGDRTYSNAAEAPNAPIMKFQVINAKSINFGLPADYRIIYTPVTGSPTMYAGNKDIPFVAETAQGVNLILTHKDLLGKPTDIKVMGINTVLIYEDKGTVGVLDAGDVLVNTIMPGSYDETIFTPNGPTPKLMVIYYTKQPYVFNYTDGDASLLPRTTTFSQRILFENNNFGDTYLANTRKNAPQLLDPRPITLNDATIPGIGLAAASGVTYIPLGGDISGTEGYTGEVYSWAPVWAGHYAITGTAKTTPLTLQHEVMGFMEVASTAEQVKHFLGSFQSYDTQVMRMVYSVTPGNEQLFSIYRPEVISTRKFIPIQFSDSGGSLDFKQEKTPSNMGSDMQRSSQPTIGIPDLDVGVGPMKLSYAEGEILMTIGIPVFSKTNNDPPKPTPPPPGGQPTAFKQAENAAAAKKPGYFAEKIGDIKENAKKLKDFMKQVKDDSGKKVDAKPKADYDAKFSVGLSINVLMTYNDDEGAWQFDSAMFLVNVNGSVKISQKLPAPASFIYVYVIFGADVTISTGVGMAESIDKNGAKKRVAYFKGVVLEPKFYAEIGIGIGLDGVASFEIYFKLNIEMKATIAAQDPNNRENFSSSFDEFSVRGALGFRIELLCVFTYEMDVIGFKIEYKREGHDGDASKLWKFSKVLFEHSGGGEIFSLNAGADSGGGSGINYFTDPSAPTLLDSTSNAGSEELGSKTYLSSRRDSRQQIGALGGFDGQGQSDMLQDQNDNGGIVLFAIDNFPVSSDGMFSFGSFNTDSYASLLGDQLRNSSTMKLAEIGNRQFIFFLMDGGGSRNDYDANMLVYSELDTSTQPYKLSTPKPVHDDLTGDSDFTVVSDGTTIHVAWVNQKVALGNDTAFLALDAVDALAALAENTELRYATISSAGAVSTPITVSEESLVGSEYLPSMAVNGSYVAVSYMQSKPYTKAEMDAFLENMLVELGYYESMDLYERSTILEEVNMKRYMLCAFGKYSSLHVASLNAAQTAFASASLNTAQGSAQQRAAGTYSQDTTVSQHKLAWLDDNTLGFAYILELPGDFAGNKATLKNLYLGFASYNSSTQAVAMNANAPAYLLKSLVDYKVDTYTEQPDGTSVINEGVLTGATVTTPFADPFYASINFGKAVFTSNGPVEAYFTYNMNGRHYYLNQANVNDIRSGSASADATPFFEEKEGEVGDGKSSLKLATKDDGTLVAVAVENVAYTENNVLFVYDFDVDTQTWGEGRPLAMRGLDIYDRLRNGDITQEESEVQYRADYTQLTFSNPHIFAATSGSIMVLTEASIIELADQVIIANGETFTQRMPVMQTTGNNRLMKEADKQFYAIKYVSETKDIGEALLTFDDDVVVPGNVITPYVSFTNTGTKPLWATSVNPIEVTLRVGTDIASDPVLTNWIIEDHIPVGRVVNLYFADGVPLPAWSTLLSDTDNRIYFTVYETEAAPSASGVTFDFSSYATKYGSKEVKDAPDLHFSQTTFNAGEIFASNSLALDYTLEIENRGSKPAENVKLHAFYEVVNAISGETVRQKASIFGTGISVISVGDISNGAGDNVWRLVYSHSDYLRKANGEYILTLVGEKLQLDTSNDAYIPHTYFDNGKLKLVFELSSDTEEIDPMNNIAHIKIEDYGYIEASDSITLSTEATDAETMNVTTFVMNGDGNLVLTELPIEGDTLLLSYMEYIKNGNTVLLKAVRPGQTILRLRIDNTNIIKDVIVTITGDEQSETPDTTAPVITLSAPVDANALRYTPLVVRYTVTDDNLLTVRDSSGPQVVKAGQYEFTITANGNYSIVARDSAGNETIVSIPVYGFSVEDDRLVTKLQITDMRWNSVTDINLLPQMPYVRADINFSFTAEAPNQIRSIDITHTDGDASTVVLTRSLEGETIFKFAVANHPLHENGTYTVTVTDKQGAKATAQFSIDKIDKEIPTLELVVNNGIVNFKATDNIGVKNVMLLQNNVLVETLHTNVNEQTEITGFGTLPSEGEYTVRVEDFAGNATLMNLSSRFAQPVPKSIIPTMTMYVGEAVTFSADDVATSTGEGDTLTIVSIATNPNLSVAYPSLDADGKVTLRGDKPGNTSITVRVQNSEGVHTDVLVPITVLGRSMPIPNKNVIAGTPAASTRPAIKVAGIELFFTEQQNGHKAVITISGVQLEELLKADQNPLVFDISGVSKAVEVAFSRSNLAALAKAGKGITITTQTGSMTIDAEALLDITNQLTGAQVSIIIEAMTADTLPSDMPEAQLQVITDMLAKGIPVYSIRITSSGVDIHEFEGTMVVTFAWDEAEGTYVALYIDEDGTLTEYATVFDAENEVLSLPLEHLSYYAIEAKEAEEVPPVVDDVDHPADEVFAIILTIGSTRVVQGNQVLAEPPVAPAILGDRTMLPFRYLIQTLLGGDVHWEEATRTVTAYINGHTFEMTIDIDEVTIDGQSASFGQAPVIVNDYTLVPLRVFEAAVESIMWHEDTRTVEIFPHVDAE